MAVHLVLVAAVVAVVVAADFTVAITLAVSVDVKHTEALGNVVLKVATVVDKKLNELIKVDAALMTVNIFYHRVKFSLSRTEAMLPQNLRKIQ